MTEPRGVSELTQPDKRIDFVIAGAQKAGTTQLAEILSRVRDIWIRPREDEAFESPHYERGRVQVLAAEIADKRGSARSAGIKRASYLADKQVPGRIRAHNPDARPIVILRDPVDRAVSAYLHKAQYGRIRLLPVSEAMAALLAGDDLGSPRSAEILGWSRYASLLPPWQEAFGENLLILESHALRLDTGDVRKLVTAHLGVDPVTTSAPPATTNVGATTLTEMAWRRRMHRAITLVDPDSRQVIGRTMNPARLAAGAVFRTAARAVHRRHPLREEAFQLDAGTREQLRETFAADYDYVAEQVGIEF